MAKKRHLTVLQDHEPVAEEQRSIPFLLLIGTASSLVAWIVVATLVGLVAETLARSGQLVTAIVNLLGLGVAAGAGGALVAYQAPKASPWVARSSGGLTALVGWIASFAMSRASDLPDQPNLGTWAGLLALMAGVGAVGAAVAFAFTKARLARMPATPPDPT